MYKVNLRAFTHLRTNKLYNFASMHNWKISFEWTQHSVMRVITCSVTVGCLCDAVSIYLTYCFAHTSLSQLYRRDQVQLSWNIRARLTCCHIRHHRCVCSWRQTCAWCCCRACDSAWRADCGRRGEARSARSSALVYCCRSRRCRSLAASAAAASCNSRTQSWMSAQDIHSLVAVVGIWHVVCYWNNHRSALCTQCG